MEDEQERGINRPFMKDEDDDEDEYGLDCFLYWNGELLRPLEEDAAIAHPANLFFFLFNNKLVENSNFQKIIILLININ